MGNVTAQLAPVTVENTRSAVAKPTYIATAEKNIAEFIERSTRHSVANASCEWTQTGTADFDVVLSVSLDVVTHDDDHTGRHHPGEHDIGTKTRDEYRSTVDKVIAAERSRTETVLALSASVTEAGYGKITEPVIFRRHPQRIFYTYSCTSCNGNGHITCRGCGGQRTIWQTCSSCYGQGYREQRRTVQRYTNSPPETVVDRYSCTSCSGGRVMMNCPKCSGRGTETCSSCSGQGCFTRVTSINVMANPSYSAHYTSNVPQHVRDAVERRAGLAKLVPDIADLLAEQTSQVGQEFGLKTSYRMSCPWAIGDVFTGQIRAKAEIYGKNGSIHSVGGLIEKLVAEDAATLDETTSGPLFDRAHTAARSGAVAKFMESEINQSIFELATQMVKVKTEAGGPKRISDQLNHAVSEEYVKRAIVAIEAIAGRAFKANSIVSIAATAFLSVPALISAVLLFADAESALVVLGQRWLLVPGTNDLLSAALYTTPLALFTYMALRFGCKRWTRKCGGNVLATYLAERKRYPSYPSALVLLIAAALPAVALTSKLGVWLDADKTLYGSRLVVEQPKATALKAKNESEKRRK